MVNKDIIYMHEPLWEKWYVDKLIGSGSYGSVYKITRDDWGYKQEAAVKVISISANDNEQMDLSFENLDENSIEKYYEDIVKNLIQEIQMLYKLKGNSNIVSYEDHMVIKGKQKSEWHIFIRMEYLTPLSQYILSNPLKTKDIIQLGLDICTGLEVCKSQNIMHRDVKEANIFVTKNGVFKLGDFGISRELLKSNSIASMKGTPYYMAPETFKENKYDERVDIYSLGIVLYKLLNYGRMPFLPQYPEPFSSSDREKAFEQRISGKSIIPPLLGVKDLQNIILKACKYNPKGRYGSASEMKNDLTKVLNSMSDSEKDDIITIIPGINSSDNRPDFFDEAEPANNNPTNIETRTINFNSDNNIPDNNKPENHLRKKLTQDKGFKRAIITASTAIIGIVAVIILVLNTNSPIPKSNKAQADISSSSVPNPSSTVNSAVLIEEGLVLTEANASETPDNSENQTPLDNESPNIQEGGNYGNDNNITTSNTKTTKPATSTKTPGTTTNITSSTKTLKTIVASTSPTPIESGLADLVFTSAKITSSTADKITYSYTIKNNGSKTIDSLYNISIQNFFSSDKIFYNSDDSPGGGSILAVSQSLAPGKTYTGTFYSLMDVPSGMSYLTAKIDFNNSLNESNENNNTIAILLP